MLSLESEMLWKKWDCELKFLSPQEKGWSLYFQTSCLCYFSSIGCLVKITQAKVSKKNEAGVVPITSLVCTEIKSKIKFNAPS
jgi:hypothetical protein